MICNIFNKRIELQPVEPFLRIKYSETSHRTSVLLQGPHFNGLVERTNVLKRKRFSKCVEAQAFFVQSPLNCRR
jgi:hypothetical protein